MPANLPELPRKTNLANPYAPSRTVYGHTDDALRAYGEACRGEDGRDAERYRWIREQQRRHGTMVQMQAICWNTTGRGAFDAAIDAAMNPTPERTPA